MAVNLGINIQRSPNRINQQLREAGVGGKYPKLLLDFADNYYLASGGSKTLANAVTHARAGNATMTDGYGAELVTNGDFSDGITGWSTDGNPTVSRGVVTIPIDNATTEYIEQTLSTVSGKTYIVSYDYIDADATGRGIRTSANDGTSGNFNGDLAAENISLANSNGNVELVFTATSSNSTVRIICNNATNGAFVSIDNVSVREMPVIKWAPHNLLTYSEDFSNAAWNKSGFSVNADQTTAPNGAQTADEITTTGTSGSVQNATSLSASVSHTIVCYAKYIDNPWIRIARESSAVNAAWFNIQTGVAGSVTDAADSSSITDVGNGWYRLELVMAAPTPSSQINFVSLSNSDNSTSMTSGKSAYIWGFHLYRSDLGGMVDNPERGDSYVPTTSSAVYLPRVGHHVYNGSAWVNEGVLAESESRTNLVSYSDFSSGFSVNGIALTANEAVSPDGTENAAEIAESTDPSAHYAFDELTLTASTDYTMSVYVKQGSGSRSAILRTMQQGGTTYVIFDFSSETITETGSAASNATSQSVGNGWYRIAFTYTQSGSTDGGFIVGLSNSTTPSTSLPSYTGDGSSSIYFYGAQFEQASTPSSLIPTSGSTVTRAAETFTIPSANLPWPTPQYIGSELVTNGTFDTDSDWIEHATWNISGGVATHSATNGGGLSQAWTPTAGSVYEITFTITGATSGNAYYAFSSASGLVANQIIGTIRTTNGTYKEYIVADATTVYHGVWGTSTFDGSVDNISVREINPLAVSIGMEGRMTYADEDAGGTAFFYRWQEDANYIIRTSLDTNLGRSGRISFQQVESGTFDIANADDDILSPDVLVPFNIASRHGSTFINGAIDGVALTANTTPTALPDLSSTDLNLAYDYMGTISEFRVWDKDLGDAGLVEATEPSLEPSLSLTFEGVGTNSFVVNDWSE